MKYSAKIHKNGDVTAWDVYTQQWERRPARAQMLHELWQGLSERDRARIEAAANGRTLGAAQKICQKINDMPYADALAYQSALDDAGVWYAYEDIRSRAG